MLLKENFKYRFNSGSIAFKLVDSVSSKQKALYLANLSAVYLDAVWLSDEQSKHSRLSVRESLNVNILFPRSALGHHLWLPKSSAQVDHLLTNILFLEGSACPWVLPTPGHLCLSSSNTGWGCLSHHNTSHPVISHHITSFTQHVFTEHLAHAKHYFRH